MKHLLTTLFTVCLSFTAAVAQEKTTEKALQEKTMSKEDKAAAKAKKVANLQANLQEAFNKAGVTADEQQKAKTILEENVALNKTIKADTSLSDDQKMEKANNNNKAKDAKLKELLGEAKYKAFKDIQKTQKGARGI